MSLSLGFMEGCKVCCVFINSTSLIVTGHNQKEAIVASMLLPRYHSDINGTEAMKIFWDIGQGLKIVSWRYLYSIYNLPACAIKQLCGLSLLCLYIYLPWVGFMQQMASELCSAQTWKIRLVVASQSDLGDPFPLWCHYPNVLPKTKTC